MKTIARAFVFGFTLATSIAAIACWPLAPSGGTFPDASVPPGRDGASSDDDGSAEDSSSDGTIQNDGASSKDGGETDAAGDVDAADAADATVPLPPPFPSQTLGTGLAFGCHVASNQAVWCWGVNQFGQTGLQPPPQGPADDGGPHEVMLSADAGPLYATAVALGDDYACAIAADAGGAVYCWGRNDATQLGHSGSDVLCIVPNDGPYECNPAPTPATGVTGAVFLAAAGAQTCAASASGAIQCWGTPPTGADASATGVSSNGLVQLSIASDHFCALADAGDAGNVMACWGDNGEVQSSPGSSCAGGYCATPTTVTAIATPAAVAAGLGFTCAVPGDGGVVCFGDNTRGELGHAPYSVDADVPIGGGRVINPIPEQVAGLAGAVAALVATGNDQAACALQVSGSVTCWGNVGAGSWGPDGGLPPLSGLGAPDGLYVCGESNDGGVWCWSLDGGSPAQLQ